MQAQTIEQADQEFARFGNASFWDVDELIECAGITKETEAELLKACTAKDLRPYERRVRTVTVWLDLSEAARLDINHAIDFEVRLGGRVG